jgi:hypothetical protein
LLSGEAGIGKSRLAAQLAAEVASEPHTRLRYQCSPYHRDSVLHPFVVQLGRAARLAPDDLPEAQLDKFMLKRLCLIMSSRLNCAASFHLLAFRCAYLGRPRFDRFPRSFEPTQKNNYNN